MAGVAVPVAGVAVLFDVTVPVPGVDVLVAGLAVPVAGVAVPVTSDLLFQLFLSIALSEPSQTTELRHPPRRKMASWLL